MVHIYHIKMINGCPLNCMCNIKSLVTSNDQHHLENEDAINGSIAELTSSLKEIDYNDNNNVNTSSTGEISEDITHPLRNLRNLALKMFCCL